MNWVATNLPLPAFSKLLFGRMRDNKNMPIPEE